MSEPDYSSTFIPYGRQDLDQSDIDAVIKVLKSDYITQGPTTVLFEGELARYCSSNYAISTNSATSALHIACLALGVKRGDIVWTSAITFVASANCALYCGASVDFVDIDPQTYNMSVESLSRKLAKAKIQGTLPSVVIPVHLCGQSCDMESIHSLSKKYGFKIIEDASHAIGGRYKNKPIGSCSYSDITVFSFHPVKIITTGEGGMAMTNSEELANRMRLFRSHGISSQINSRDVISTEEMWNYQQIDLGFNYRMTDIQAALGLSQLKKLDTFVGRRTHLAKRYTEKLSCLPVLTPWQHPSATSSYHLYPLRLLASKSKITRNFFYKALQAAGVGVNLHYIPVYLHPYYMKIGFNYGYCEQAEKYFLDAVTIPLYSGMTEQQQDRIIDEIKFFFR